ncbi:phage tail tape measure protein [Virgibacillus oceani]|uniref:Phage tail tape measure protein domain-containing protein n=1 Tax=Virgibacillus oceani TaxID=1479511 RepID=A0A917H1X1_9BACI|nr:phage tail tape measure protein [Virgibacillus oceani]GGG64795.1 hypothetical protein GCM10011398_05520 [Virgibacillus oceani]
MARKKNETQVTFSVFNKDFNKGMNEMRDESKRLNKEFKLQQAQMRDTATATEKLEAKIEYLGKEYDITRRKIKSTEEQLEKAKETYGENSNEANKLSNKLLDLRISEQKLENSINYSRKEIDKQGQEMVETSEGADKLKRSLQDISETASDVGDKLNTGVTLPLAGLGAAGGAAAISMDDAIQLMIGSLGAVGDEAKQLETDMRTVWEDGFGDNPEQVARSIALIKQNIQGIDDGEELQKVTKNMLILSKTTESDMSEATRGVNQLMHNFGITSQEALDLFTKGQQEGINYSQEMFDNVSEYAPLFKQMGFTAEEYFSILANGTKNGAYNLDYINDLMKEFNIRVQDGSDTTADAFKGMSKETQNLFKEFENGEATAEDLFKQVIPELENMDDQVKANQIGVELFGTKFEDLEKTTVYSLDNVNDAFKDTEGAMDDLAKTQEEAIGVKAQRAWRNLQKAVEPIGEELLDILEDITPKIEDLAEWFVNLDDETRDYLLTLGGTAAAAGPALKTFSALSRLVGGLHGGFGKAGAAAGKKGFGGTLLRVISKAGPVGLAVGVIGGLSVAINNLISDEEELNKVSFKKYDSLMKQHESNAKMIEQYDMLRNQSKLTADEFERYVDLQSELQEATDPEVIKAIKDEMAELEEKSGFTNGELDTMVGLNDDLVDALPGASGEITDQGKAVAGTTGELKKYNSEISKMATLELEGQYLDALENQSKLLKDRTEQQNKFNMLKDHESIVAQVLDNYNQQSVDSALTKLETQGKELRNLINSGQLRGEELELAKQQEKVNANIRQALSEGESELNKQLRTLKQQKNEQEIKILNTDKEIAKLGQVFQKLQTNYLVSAGITEEKAYQAYQDGKALEVLDNKISKLQEEKQKLKENTPAAQRNTEEYRDQVSEIDDQIDKLNTAKGKIKDLSKDAEDYTDELGEDVTKNVIANLSPSADAIDKRLQKAVSKKVGVYTDYIRGNAPSFFGDSNADGTNFFNHPSGRSWLGEKGTELINEGNKWWLADFGLYNLKQGAKVFTAEQTDKIFSGLSKLPGYATGKGVSPEMSRNLDRMSSALTMSNNINNQLNVQIGVGDVIINDRIAGQILWRPIKENIDFHERRNETFRR